MKRSLPALACLVLALAGCTSSSTTASSSPTPSPVTNPQLACPAQPGKPFTWPASMPQDLPKPPSSVYQSAATSTDKVTIVRLTSTLSLQQSVLFVLKDLNKAGFTLGRGDAEPTEADAPFGRGDLRGIYKMIVRDTCVTDWVIATGKVALGGTSPVLPTASRGPSSSPLPFG